MSRVMAQGDFRPMAQNRDPSKGAMADLVAILEARRADYARAEAEIDTLGRVPLNKALPSFAHRYAAGSGEARRP